MQTADNHPLNCLAAVKPRYKSRYSHTRRQHAPEIDGCDHQPVSRFASHATFGRPGRGGYGRGRAAYLCRSCRDAFLLPTSQHPLTAPDIKAGDDLLPAELILRRVNLAP
jgi:hypothetical protein